MKREKFAYDIAMASLGYIVHQIKPDTHEEMMDHIFDAFMKTYNAVLQSEHPSLEVIDALDIDD